LSFDILMFLTGQPDCDDRIMCVAMPLA